MWPGRNGFPDLRQYKVTGVYRKYSDIVAKARVDAFLRIIREHVAKGADDSKPKEKILGAAFVGQRILGSIKWQCHGGSMEEIH